VGKGEAIYTNLSSIRKTENPGIFKFMEGQYEPCDPSCPCLSVNFHRSNDEMDGSCFFNNLNLFVKIG